MGPLPELPPPLLLGGRNCGVTFPLLGGCIDAGEVLPELGAAVGGDRLLGKAGVPALSPITALLIGNEMKTPALIPSGFDNASGWSILALIQSLKMSKVCGAG